MKLVPAGNEKVFSNPKLSSYIGIVITLCFIYKWGGESHRQLK